MKKADLIELLGLVIIFVILLGYVTYAFNYAVSYIQPLPNDVRVFLLTTFYLFVVLIILAFIVSFLVLLIEVKLSE